jgi:hypothetical protein
MGGRGPLRADTDCLDCRALLSSRLDIMLREWPDEHGIEVNLDTDGSRKAFSFRADHDVLGKCTCVRHQQTAVGNLTTWQCKETFPAYIESMDSTGRTAIRGLVEESTRFPLCRTVSEAAVSRLILSASSGGTRFTSEAR